MHEGTDWWLLSGIYLIQLFTQCWLLDSIDNCQEDYMSVLGEEDRPPHRWLVYGPNQSGSPFHLDPYQTSAWNALISWQKRWALYLHDHYPPGTHWWQCLLTIQCWPCSPFITYKECAWSSLKSVRLQSTNWCFDAGRLSQKTEYHFQTFSIPWPTLLPNWTMQLAGELMAWAIQAILLAWTAARRCQLLLALMVLLQPIDVQPPTASYGVVYPVKKDADSNHWW